MTATHKVVTAALVLSVCLFAGCTTTVRVLVNNPSNEIFPVEVSGRGIGVMNLGRIYSDGGRLDRDLTFKDKELPSKVTLKVGDMKQYFVVTPDGPSVFRFHVSLDGKILKSRGEDPVDEEYKKKIEVPMTEPVEVIE